MSLKLRRLITCLIIKELFPFVSIEIFIKIIETAIMKYQFNSDLFIKRVREGRVEDLDTEQMQIFEKILPK